MFDFSKLVQSRFKEKKIDDVAILSIFRKTLIEIFTERWIEIDTYIISIQKKENTFIIKTNKPLINQEISFAQSEIEKSFLSKMESIWQKSKEIKIKYL